MWTLPLLGAWVVLVAGTALALPAGPEFQVNTDTAGDQGYPAACIDDAGGATVAWESLGADGTSAVRTRRFDAAGVALGGEATLDALTGGLAQAPAIACAPDRGYVVAWERRDGDDFDIAARRVGADGTASPPDAINATFSGRQRAPAVCTDVGGNFVVAWQSDGQDGDGYDIVARRFDATGAPRVDELLVNTTTADAQQHPAIACGRAGDFVVVWESRGQDGDGGAIVARRFAADGTGGDEHLLSTTAAGDQRLPSIAALPNDGGFFVAWESEGQDGDESGIVARRVDADLTPLDGEIAVNSVAAYSQEQPAVAVSGDGIAVAWSSPGDGDGYGIFARRFDGAGGALGPEILVNLATAGTQGAVSDEGGGVTAAGNAAGALLVAWQSLRLRGPQPDGDGLGIFARAAPATTCAGDCNGDGSVGIEELVRGVGLAVLDESAATCAALDANGDDRIVINELIAAVAAALNGCANGLTADASRGHRG